MKQVDLLVLGAGPAGIAAAVTAADHGLTVTLVNEGEKLGGQVLVNKEPPDHSTHEGRAILRGKELLQQLQHLPVQIEDQTIAWGIEGRRVALTSPEGSHEIAASMMIIATGAREFVPPFTGWTLPGVMTLGGAQHLTSWYGILPGKSILIAGTGPLMWALAATTLQHGGNLVEILDASRPATWLRALPHLKSLWDRIGLGWHYLNEIRTHRVPYRWTRNVLRAYGTNELERVTVGGRSFEVDTLCVGFGFRPNIELFQLAGCTLTFEPSLGGWIPAVDENLCTDQDGIFAAGECAGVGGAEKALVEGELAAFSAITSLGQRLSSRDQKRLNGLRKRRRSELNFARVLNRASQPAPDYLREIEDDTCLCRCENVRAAEIRTAIQHGSHTLGGLKNELRVGQGMCQGRTCGPILQSMLAFDQQRLDDPPEPFHVRPPVKPVPLGQMERRA
ncbi:MAG: FAD/NAD(P)-binding oxidoreductase [Anaerolineales bacterium]|jgi:NADPH-dependent 2,4-dienoyl-CoA reductase/sulfur reductase-like enzyme/bacterioferritin-associated ferredoxin